MLSSAVILTAVKILVIFVKFISGQKDGQTKGYYTERLNNQMKGRWKDVKTKIWKGGQTK